MEMTGRLTGNATIASISNTDRKVVNFTLAINDSYRAKSNSESKEFVTYIDCAYWIGTGVAGLLTKGSLITVNGRLYPNAYINRLGEPKGGIRCHADKIKVHFSKKTEAVSPVPSELTEPLDDLPF